MKGHWSDPSKGSAELARGGASRRRVPAVPGLVPLAAWATVLDAGLAGAETPASAGEQVGVKTAGPVDIGGRALYADVRGSGAPAVVFDAGHGADARSWLLVQPDLASDVLTVSYDRAARMARLTRVLSLSPEMFTPPHEVVDTRG